MGDLPGGDGDGAAEMRSETSHLTSRTAPNIFEIGSENRAIAEGEGVAREIIQKVQPNSMSEESRRGVINYMQRLTRSRLGVEVFPYGSVPLKTYLPDGDIDLTVFGGTNAVDNLADGMKSVLEEEEKATTTEFVLKDVQLVHAEVKIVKCIVEDIVVDVSFNQIGGLCTLCFLEQVDRLIGKDHLFKQSIILIKAWCYYESRILGAHHGLISTYALEILVLYIFHLFHSKLDGPLTVLYKFLDYFSKFDWENYCISINGPVCLSSLPDFVAEMPEGSDRDLLLPNDFLSSCIGMFSVPSTAGEKSALSFPRKHLNIVDPLKEQNNLGRSVSKGNFYRICSAFSYGARKLSRIFLQPEHSIVDELHRFFSNTMTRHGGGKRPDVRDFDTLLISNRHILPLLIPDKVDKSSESFDEYAISTGETQSSSSCKLAQDSQKGMEIELHNAGRNLSSRSIAPGPSCSVDQTNLATSGPESLTDSTDSLRCQATVVKEAASPVRVPLFVPHRYFSESKLHGSFEDEIPDSDTLDKHANNDERRTAIGGNLDKDPLAAKDYLVASSKPKDSLVPSSSSFFPGHLNHIELDKGSAIGNETPESVSSFDLSGDYETYLKCLRYGRWCIGYCFGMHSWLFSPSPTSPYQKNNPWCGLLPHSHFECKGMAPIHHNGFHPTTSVYGMQPMLAADFMYGWEEAPKPRGIGTYFPNLVQDNVALAKRWNQAPFQNPYPSGSSIQTEGTIELDTVGHAAATSVPEKNRRKAWPSSPGTLPKMVRSYSAFRKE